MVFYSAKINCIFPEGKPQSIILWTKKQLLLDFIFLSRRNENVAKYIVLVIEIFIRFL